MKMGKKGIKDMVAVALGLVYLRQRKFIPLRKASRSSLVLSANQREGRSVILYHPPGRCGAARACFIS